MADVLIGSNVSGTLDGRVVRAGTFWTTPLIGYVIYLTLANDLVYRKTTDGGSNWGSEIQVVAPGSCDAAAFDCWADWQTVGDAGTKIHIVYTSLDTNGVRYVYLDTSGDSVGGDDLIETCQGTGTFGSATNFLKHMLSITKTRGGNLAVALKYQDDAIAKFNAFYTSPDATTWTSKTSPYEDFADLCLLFPGNEADNQDLWATYWDNSANTISLKTFDDSGNSWGEITISSSMVRAINYVNMEGQIRLSDGHLIFAAWSAFDDAGADLKVWDINGAGSRILKTNVITDEAENFLVSVFINQLNDDIYITYVQGTAAQSLVKCVYQKSSDGGDNWDGETAMQADAEDDIKWVSAGVMKPTQGKFQPIWYNDDLNGLFTNSDNGVSIAKKAKRGWAQK